MWPSHAFLEEEENLEFIIVKIYELISTNLQKVIILVKVMTLWKKVFGQKVLPAFIDTSSLSLI